jgi:hypothetical protein
MLGVLLNKMPHNDSSPELSSRVPFAHMQVQATVHVRPGTQRTTPGLSCCTPCIASTAWLHSSSGTRCAPRRGPTCPIWLQHSDQVYSEKCGTPNRSSHVLDGMLFCDCHPKCAIRLLAAHCGFCNMLPWRCTLCNEKCHLTLNDQARCTQSVHHYADLYQSMC